MSTLCYELWRHFRSVEGRVGIVNKFSLGKAVMYSCSRYVAPVARMTVSSLLLLSYFAFV